MARAAGLASDVVDQVTAGDPVTEAVEPTEKSPALQLDGSLSIPVSRKAGIRWKGKLSDALAAYKDERDLWDAAFEQYRKVTSDEMINEAAGNERYRHTADHRTDENLVRETVKLMLRTTYTRNPKIEFSTEDEQRKPMSKLLTRAINALMERQQYPGIGAKAAIRRQIVHTHLTNFGIIKLCYQKKLGSRQEALQLLHDLQEELSKEKDTKKIELLYGQLEELDESLPLTANKGISLENTLPPRLIIDPNCTKLTLTDADWAMEEISLGKSYIKSKYMKQVDGKWVRLSDSKGKGDQDNNSEDTKKLEDAVSNIVLGHTSEERTAYLNKDNKRCYLIWDRLAQQILLFDDDDWSYPLWVWADDLQLSCFYPFFLSGFTEPVEGIVQAGETSFYAGQAAEVNMINRKVHQIRNSIFGAVVYNAKETQKETIELLIKHLENPSRVKAFGIEFDPEKKLEDVVKVFAPPAYEYKDLFDKTNIYNTINRTASVTDAMKGSQFKVNTNTTAVNSYNKAAEDNTGELTDIVEDSTGRLAWALAETVVSKYSMEDVIELIGRDNAKVFQPMTVAEFNSTFSMLVVAGSSEKPTSDQKKKEAIEVAQSIGQVGQGAPGTSMTIILKMFDQAFSDFEVTDEDWTALKAEIEANLSKGQAAPSPSGQTPGAPPKAPAMATRGPTNAAQ